MGSTLFNGSTDVIIPVTLVDSGVIPGTYVAPQMVIDSKGRIVSATSTSVGAGGITGALGYVPANDANVVHKTGDTMTGSLVIASADINVTGTGRHRQDGNELLPRGVITMWTGSTAPAGWALCDGTNSTPNLSGRFIVGIGGGYTIGVTGGNNFLTATSDSQLGTINGGGSTDTQGSHSHFGQTGDHTLSVNEMPSHNHVVSANVDNLGSPYTFTGINGNLRIADAGTTYSGGNQPHNHPINTDGAHAHNISVSFNAAHAHSTSWDNRAAYYALAYIMKL
jgi:microcystin-dependent protein